MKPSRGAIFCTLLMVTMPAWAQIAADHLAERIAIVNDLRVARVDRKVTTQQGETVTNAAAMVMRMSQRKQWYVRPGMRFDPQSGHTFRLVRIQDDDAVTISDKQQNLYTLQLITREEKDEYRKIHNMPKDAE